MSDELLEILTFLIFLTAKFAHMGQTVLVTLSSANAIMGLTHRRIGATMQFYYVRLMAWHHRSMSLTLYVRSVKHITPP